VWVQAKMTVAGFPMCAGGDSSADVLYVSWSRDWASCVWLEREKKSSLQLWTGPALGMRSERGGAKASVSA
jgi:hypothetical protein